jgi:CTP:molybdopterin cytidylyltransferase MocA
MGPVDVRTEEDDPAGPRPPIATVGVLLAAGGGRRFAGTTHKLLAPIDGQTVAGRSLAVARRVGFAHLIVVTGAVALELPADVVEVANPSWANGLATSLQAAIAHAIGLGATAVVVGLADQPFVTVSAWRAVASSPAPIAVATYDGVPGNPVRLGATVWPLLPIDGDEGARSLIRVRPELVQEVPCAGHPTDIDTTEDLARWS